MARSNKVNQGMQYQPSLFGGLTVEPIPRTVADNYATALYVGDPVSQVSDGTVARTAAGSGTAIWGVVVGIKQYVNAEGILQKHGTRIPANTRWTAFTERSQVLVVPCLNGVLFGVDGDDASSATTYAAAEAFVGENADHIFGTADTGLGLSPTLLDISTHNTTNTLQWRIWGLWNAPGNDPAGGANFRYIVGANVREPDAILGI